MTKFREWLDDPQNMRGFAGWFAVALIPWTIVLAIPGSPLIKLGSSVVYVTFISHLALILALWGAWQAARVEEKQD